MTDPFYIDYDEFSRTYAANRAASPTVVAHILQKMQAQPHGGVLEIGCGTADHLFILSQAWKVRGQGFDRSEGMIGQAQEKNPGLELSLGDASARFPYPDDAFDFAYSVNVIHYIPDLGSYLREAARILKPGGVVLTVTDSEADIRNRTMAKYFPEIVDVELQRYPPIAKIEAAMQAAGFDQTWITHTEQTFPLDESRLEPYRNRAYSSLRLIPDERFRTGLQRLEADVRHGDVQGHEIYTFVWGRKSGPHAELSLRIATREDAPLLAHHRSLMFAEMRRLQGREFPPDVQEAMEAVYLGHLQRYLADGTATAWIIEDGEIPAASGVIYRQPWTVYPNNLSGMVASLHSMYTEPQYRQRGLARRVVQAAIDCCRSEGIGHIMLGASDAGKPLYESIGFQPSPRTMVLQL